MHQQSTDSIRVFSGFAIDEASRARLYSALTPVRSQVPGFRWIPPERWHVTAQFYGEVSWNIALQLADALTELQDHNPRVQLQEIGAFPSMRDPRVLWVGVTPMTLSLRAVVSKVHALGQSMNFAPEDRPYLPHITIGRRSSETLQTISVPKIWRKTPSETNLEPVTLFRSEWTSSGPKYTPIRASKSTK